MRLGAFSAGYVAKVGVAAVLFILLFKWVAGKSGIAPLGAVAAMV